MFCLLYPNQIVSYRITLNNEAAIIDLPEMLDFKVADVQMIKLFDSVFVLLSSNRNIMVYDLMLKYTIYRSNYNTRSPAFDRCSLAETADKLLLLTHNED